MKLLRRMWAWCKRQVRQPALDVVGVGVMGTLTGRLAFYGLLVPSLATAGWTAQAVVIGVLAVLDLMIHLQVLAALQRSMLVAVRDELFFGAPA